MLGLCEPSPAHHQNLVVVFTPVPKEKCLSNEKKVSWLLPVAAPKPLVIWTLIEKKAARPPPRPPPALPARPLRHSLKVPSQETTGGKRLLS